MCIRDRYRGAPRTCVTSSPPCISNLVVNETSSSVTVPPTRQGPCSENARPRPTPEAISKTSWLWSAGASENRSETPKKDLGKRWPRSARRLRRGRNFVDSSIPRGSTEPTNGGRVCQPGLTVANFFANGRKRLTEQKFPSPLAWAFGSGIIARRTIPHTGTRGLALANRLLPVLKKVMFHGGVLRGSGVFAR